MVNFKLILLYILSRINGQRTVYSGYHILQGKKSAQTIQDIHLFQLKEVFSILPQLNKDVYSNWIDRLVTEGYIEVDSVTFAVTQKGKLLIESEVANPVNNLNGFKYHKIDYKWFKTLQLLFQSLSNLTYQNRRFIPITDDFESQVHVKKILSVQNHQSLAELLKKELKFLLSECNELCADIFTLQLSGYNRIGLNQRQVSDLFQLNVEDVQVITKDLIHNMLTNINHDRDLYPILSGLIREGDQTSLTSSAQKTYLLLQKGRSIKEIERIRHLKESTVQDHIIEIATQVDDFDIEVFVDSETVNNVIKVLEQTNTKRLKNLMEHLNHSVSYFELRLVLAKYHTYKESVAND